MPIFKHIITTNSSSIVISSKKIINKIFYNKSSYYNELKILSMIEHPNIIKINLYKLLRFNNV